MSPQGAGTGKTPKRVIELLLDEVAKTNQSATARATGMNQAAIGRYIKGIGEPNTATLEKLADYFGVTVEWLRGGSGKTPPRVVELLNKEVSSVGFDTVVINSTLQPVTLKLLLDGIGEPSEKTIYYLADLLRTTPAYLWGIDNQKKYDEAEQKELAELTNDAIELFHYAPDRLKYAAQMLARYICDSIQGNLYGDDCIEETEQDEHKTYTDCLAKLYPILDLNLTPPWRSEDPEQSPPSS